MSESKKLPPDMLVDPRLVFLANLFSEAASILVFLIGVLVLIGWKFNLPYLTGAEFHYLPMTPNIAIGLLLLGISLWMLQEKRSKRWMRYLGKWCAVAVIMLGSLFLAEHFIGRNLFIDQLFFAGLPDEGLSNASLGRVSIGSSVIFVLLGFSLLLLRVETKRRVCPSQVLAIMAGAISVMSISGYVHDVESFFRIIKTSNAMSIYSALIFFVCQVGVLLARPDRGLMKILVVSGFIGRFSRILIPFTLIGPLFLGWLIEYGEHKNLYGSQFGVGLETTMDVLAFFILALIALIYLENKEQEETSVKTALFKNEKRYHDLVDLMSEGLGVQDKNGIITFMNRRGCEMLGYKLEELVGKPTTFVFDKVNQKILKEQMAKRRQGGRNSYKITWLRKDGGRIETIISPSPILDDQGNYAGAVAVFTDITEYNQAVDKLRESETNFKNIFNYSTDGILLIDTEKKKFVLGNEAICKQLGYNQEEIKNLGIEDIHPKKDMPYVLEQFGRVLRGETSLNTNIPVKRRNGEVFYVDISVGPTIINGKICMMGIFRDITERKHALEEIQKEQLKSAVLAEELEKFKLAVDSAAEHIIITNADGDIIYANKAVETITGFTPAEAMGAKAGKIWGGHMPKEFYEKMWHTIKEEKKTFAGEVTNYKKNGAPYVASLNIAPILDENGSVEFFVGIERDITIEKKVEEMKNDFISFVSHQLRTPLTVMRWNAEMLGSKDSGKLTREQKRYLTEIDRGESRMALLINSLLNISRLESGRLKIDPKPTNLVSFIREVVNDGVSYASAKNCALIFKNPKKEFPLVKIDQTLTREIISNLIGNAIRYSKVGKCETEVTLEQKNGYYQINVTDQGIGIPVDVQDKIFTKFFRADNAVKFETEGTGLGLYMTKLLVETSGGKIWFESVKDKGSAFHFTIPVGGMRVVKGEKTLT